MRTLLVIVSVVLASLPGCVEVEPEWEPAQCPGHWHATYYLILNGEKVDYRAYDLGSPLPVQYHLHTPNDYTWHFEPSSPRCIEFAMALSDVHTVLGNNSITLTDDRHAANGVAATYTAEGARAVQAFHATGWSDKWLMIAIDQLNQRQLEDGEKVLVLFGAYTQEEIVDWQAQVPRPPGTPVTTDADG